MFNLRLLNPFYIYKNRGEIIPFAVRIIVNLYKKIKHYAAINYIPLTKNDRLLSRYRNKHIGERAFIIGNGPSLKIEDLDKLQNEVTFGFNKIYLAFDETDWRPTYYMVEDPLDAKEYYDIIDNQEGFTKFFPQLLIDQADLPKFSNSIYFPLVWPGWDSPAEVDEPFSSNALDELYLGATVTYTAMQMACFMGFREIYLIGVDFSYNVSEQTDKENKNILLAGNEQNHFHKDYRRSGEEWYIPNMDRQKRAYEAANKAIKKMGGNIYNATRGGKLEIFPRVDFDSLF